MLTNNPFKTPLINQSKNEKIPLILILLGPPGAGKGTQATLIQSILDIPHISTGNLLRENIQKITKIGKHAQTYIDKGKLVPDELIFEMLFTYVIQKKCQNGYILDGFPRTLTQAKTYDQRIKNKATLIPINLEISDQEIIQRLTKRVICSSCHTPYHLIHLPPKKPMICDRCETPLLQRADDREEVVRHRLKVYHEQTKPLITYYSCQNILQTISCNQSKNQITKQILSIIHQKNPSQAIANTPIMTPSPTI